MLPSSPRDNDKKYKALVFKRLYFLRSCRTGNLNFLPPRLRGGAGKLVTCGASVRKNACFVGAGAGVCACLFRRPRTVHRTVRKNGRLTPGSPRDNDKKCRDCCKFALATAPYFLRSCRTERLTFSTLIDDRDPFSVFFQVLRLGVFQHSCAEEIPLLIV